MINCTLIPVEILLKPKLQFDATWTTPLNPVTIKNAQ